MGTALMEAEDVEVRNRQAFRAAMSNYPTGVAIVTTRTGAGHPVGLTVNSLASVSLDPLLLLWSVDNAVGCATEFVLGSGFAVHLLGAHQFDAAVTFATKGQDRFAQHEWSWSQRGLPILAGSAAVFECELDRAVAAGDHTLLIGRVLDVVHTDHDALLYHRRAFHSTIQIGAMP